ncbi:MAG: hypothetical protein NT154_12025 [Verrucomicrobia bacterium]|nr:hypothetical protein [Verrucomicrobiota bacterium]
MSRVNALIWKSADGARTLVSLEGDQIKVAVYEVVPEDLGELAKAIAEIQLILAGRQTFTTLAGAPA